MKMLVRGAPILVLSLFLAAGCSLLALDGAEFSGGGPELDGGQDAAVASDADGLDAEEDDDPADDGGSEAGASRYATTIAGDEPILYWRLGERNGTTAKAVVGGDGEYAIAGVALGAPGALAGDTDTAATFTDGSGRITIEGTAAFDDLAPFSVEIWANPTASNTSLGFLVDHTDWSSVDRPGWNLRAGADGVGFERWASQTSRGALGSAPLSVGQWHHVVGTFDGSTLRLYVDGSRVDQGATAVKIPTRTSTLAVGHQSCACSAINSFLGAVDELAVYDKALTEMQISAHYAAAK
ncbi:MAG: LamG domain-containing protein [Labilithrix sp.]|nr:LamG domain-containing protein [Labilithrix sp.]